jgi:D-serine deaminase-like pyridoxal phosphate-dependent protein
MPMLPPAEIGAPFAAVDTPALLIDLDAFERNLDAMAAAAKKLGVRLRPHAKTHKSPMIATKQIARGAVGVCCQKVSEAEVLVAGGVSDVLVSNEVVGAYKLERLAKLARHARIGVCVDHPDMITQLTAAADRAGSQIEVLVEIDVGAKRCGVAPGSAAVALARQIASTRALSFGGLQAYYGSAQHMRSPAERRAAIDAASKATAETVRPLADAGFACRTIGGAGTGTFELEGASGIWNELQPGSYIFMDADYAKNIADDGRNASRFEHALFVLATVMSRPTDHRAVVDAGLKALSTDSGFPVIHGHPDMRFHRAADEHGVIDLEGAAGRPQLGEKIFLIPGHCDPTVNLYDWYVGIRGFGTPNAHVETLWPVAARGAIT